MNREKGNCILADANQRTPRGEYEEHNDKEISLIPSVNDLLERPSQNEMSEDEIMHDPVGQNEFENSNENQIIHEDDPDFSSVRDRCRSHRERNTGESDKESNLENETIT